MSSSTTTQTASLAIKLLLEDPLQRRVYDNCAVAFLKNPAQKIPEHKKQQLHQIRQKQLDYVKHKTDSVDPTYGKKDRKHHAEVANSAVTEIIHYNKTARNLTAIEKVLPFIRQPDGAPFPGAFGDEIVGKLHNLWWKAVPILQQYPPLWKKEVTEVSAYQNLHDKLEKINAAIEKEVGSDYTIVIPSPFYDDENIPTIEEDGAPLVPQELPNIKPKVRKAIDKLRTSDDYKLEVQEYLVTRNSKHLDKLKEFDESVRTMPEDYYVTKRVLEPICRTLDSSAMKAPKDIGKEVENIKDGLPKQLSEYLPLNDYDSVLEGVLKALIKRHTAVIPRGPEQVAKNRAMAMARAKLAGKFEHVPALKHRDKVGDTTSDESSDDATSDDNADEDVIMHDVEVEEQPIYGADHLNDKDIQPRYINGKLMKPIGTLLKGSQIVIQEVGNDGNMYHVSKDVFPLDVMLKAGLPKMVKKEVLNSSSVDNETGEILGIRNFHCHSNGKLVPRSRAPTYLTFEDGEMMCISTFIAQNMRPSFNCFYKRVELTDALHLWIARRCRETGQTWPLSCAEPNFRDVMSYEKTTKNGKGKVKVTAKAKVKENTNKVAEAGKKYRARD